MLMSDLERCDAMDKTQALQMIRTALSEVALSDGSAATERFSGLREVDAKVRRYV